MPKRYEVYKCEKCGNIVELLHGGPGDLVCCGENMKYMKEGSIDAAQEKHVPVVEKTDTGFVVKVGSTTHPMEDKHYIEWIEIINNDDDRIYRKYLKPGAEPTAEFTINASSVTAREYCNLHGLWKKE